MWIASRDDEEQYTGRTASRGSVLGWGDELVGEFSQLSLSLSLSLVDLSMPLPCGWLVLFIGGGPGPLPKY